MHRSPLLTLVRHAAALGTAAALALAAAPANAYDLTVHVLDAKSTQGTVSGAVYRDDRAWLKPDGAIGGERVPSAPNATLVYRNLPAGRYAVSLFHDENGNGKLDTNPAGIPLERYGFSRDARGRMGPPSFEDAAIDLHADSTITVHLR